MSRPPIENHQVRIGILLLPNSHDARILAGHDVPRFSTTGGVRVAVQQSEDLLFPALLEGIDTD